MIFFEFIHIALEFLSIGTCLYIARVENNRFVQTGSVLSRGWSCAFFFCAFFDVLHAAIEFFDFNSPVVLWSWSISRMYLVTTLVMTVVISKRPDAHDCIDQKAGQIFLTFLVFLFAPAVVDVGPIVQQPDWYITRPVDLLLTLAYGYAAVFLVYKRDVWLEAPNKFYAFFMVGLFVHVLMATGSHEHLDLVFVLAHVLKVVEYGSWATVLWLETRSVSKFGGGEMERLEARAQSLGMKDDFEGLKQRFESVHRAAARHVVGNGNADSSIAPAVGGHYSESGSGEPGHASDHLQDGLCDRSTADDIWFRSQISETAITRATEWLSSRRSGTHSQNGSKTEES